MKIGFFGDSFCAEEYSRSFQYTTYISMLKTHYNAEIVHLGQGGSSASDLILLQLKPFIDKNKVPDICIFCWTEPHRLFHRTVRNLNYASANESSNEWVKNSKIWKAAQDYYEYLWDHEYTQLQYQALLEHTDNNILPILPKSTKLIHMWSFGKMLEDPKLNNNDYHYKWKHGVTVTPSLTAISLIDSNFEEFSNNNGPNHFTTKDKNEKVFKLVCDAIDNYEDLCI